MLLGNSDQNHDHELSLEICDHHIFHNTRNNRELLQFNVKVLKDILSRTPLFEICLENCTDKSVYMLACLQCLVFISNDKQGLSQDLETGCPKLAIVKFLGVLFFKVDHNILILQPNHTHVFT